MASNSTIFNENETKLINAHGKINKLPQKITNQLLSKGSSSLIDNYPFKDSQGNEKSMPAIITIKKSIDGPIFDLKVQTDHKNIKDLTIDDKNIYENVAEQLNLTPKEKSQLKVGSKINQAISVYNPANPDLIVSMNVTLHEGKVTIASAASTDNSLNATKLEQLLIAPLRKEESIKLSVTSKNSIKALQTLNRAQTTQTQNNETSQAANAHQHINQEALAQAKKDKLLNHINSLDPTQQIFQIFAAINQTIQQSNAINKEYLRLAALKSTKENTDQVSLSNNEKAELNKFLNNEPKQDSNTLNLSKNEQNILQSHIENSSELNSEPIPSNSKNQTVNLNLNERDDLVSFLEDQNTTALTNTEKKTLTQEQTELSNLNIKIKENLAKIKALEDVGEPIPKSFLETGASLVKQQQTLTDKIVNTTNKELNDNSSLSINELSKLNKSDQLDAMVINAKHHMDNNLPFHIPDDMKKDLISHLNSKQSFAIHPILNKPFLDHNAEIAKNIKTQIDNGVTLNTSHLKPEIQQAHAEQTKEENQKNAVVSNKKEQKSLGR